jgi:hypothetical protein
MFQSLQQQAIPIVIAVAFYISGFFIVANFLMLSGREVALGLAAGAVGGLCVLAAVFWSEQRQPAISARAVR